MVSSRQLNGVHGAGPESALASRRWERCRDGQEGDEWTNGRDVRGDRLFLMSHVNVLVYFVADVAVLLSELSAASLSSHPARVPSPALPRP